MPPASLPVPAGSLGVLLPPMASGRADDGIGVRTKGTTENPTFGSTDSIVETRRAAERGRAGAASLATLYGLAPRAFEHHLVDGPAAHVANVVHRYPSGATHVVALVAADDPLEHFSALMEAAAPVSTEIRAAVPQLATSGASV